jgi:hypothetical protein
MLLILKLLTPDDIFENHNILRRLRPGLAFRVTGAVN